MGNLITDVKMVHKPDKPFEMTDPRWHDSEGWIKMQYIHKNGSSDINVHYVYNELTGMVDDFKIKLW